MTDTRSVKSAPLGSPLVTFALFAYNQEKYIREAVKGAFSQTYEPLEIILSDDCSTDRTFEIMQEMAVGYVGTHQIICNKNKSNLGLIKHINSINAMASGEIIIIAAGDDISLPSRTSEHLKAYAQNNEKIKYIHTPVMRIDESGHDLGIWYPPILETSGLPGDISLCSSTVIGASQSWTSAIHRTFGPIVYKNAFEDLVISFRAALLGGIHFIDNPLVKYRFGVGLSTSHTKRTNDEKCHWLEIVRSSRIRFDVMRQRRDDCKKVGRYDLIRKINNEAKRALVRNLYARTMALLCSLKR